MRERTGLRPVVERAAEGALVRPGRYLVKRLGFRPDVVTRVRLKAADDAADYVLGEMMPCAVFDDRYPLLDLALRTAPSEGLLLEFGVYQGKSINHTARRVAPRRITGFDSFEGLAEDWSGTAALKDHFTLGGRLPRVVDNVTLVKGWFEDTLPPFLARTPGPVAFAHLDADTFASTAFVLGQIVDRLTVGSVLQFDEYLGYPGWRHGEWLAFSELCEEHGIRYRYLGVGWLSVAVEITDIG